MPTWQTSGKIPLLGATAPSRRFYRRPLTNGPDPMTYIETLQRTIQNFQHDPHAVNADMARAELKTALGTIALLERCFDLPEAIR